VGDIGASVATAVATAGVGGVVGGVVRTASIAGEVKDGIQTLQAAAGVAQDLVNGDRVSLGDAAGLVLARAGGRPKARNRLNESVDSGHLNRGGGGGDRPIHSRYSDGTPVYKDERPSRLSQGPDPDATGAHSRLRHDEANDRVYQQREFDGDGNPVRDIDHTNPTYPDGTERPGHPGPPHKHDWEVNDPDVGPRSGFKRGDPEALPE